MRYQRSGKSQRHSVLTAVLTVVILCTTLLSVPTSRMDASSAAGSSDTVRLSKVVVDSGRTLTVNVSAAHGVLPDDAAMSVKTIKRESKEYGITEKKLENYIRHQEKTLDGFLAYRIFFRSDGKDIEPDGNVTITMKWSENISPGGKISGSDRVSVIQLKEKNKSTIKDAKAVELTKNKDQGKGQMQDTDKGKEQKQEQEKKYKKDQNKENQQNQSSRQRENTPAADVRLNQKKELKWAKIKVDVPDVLTFAWIQNSSSGNRRSRKRAVSERKAD